MCLNDLRPACVCVCVCVLCRLHVFTCVAVCGVSLVRLKSLKSEYNSVHTQVFCSVMIFICDLRV